MSLQRERALYARAENDTADTANTAAPHLTCKDMPSKIHFQTPHCGVSNTAQTRRCGVCGVYRFADEAKHRKENPESLQVSRCAAVFAVFAGSVSRARIEIPPAAAPVMVHHKAATWRPAVIRSAISATTTKGDAR
jgi:hypothetical protein